MLTEEARITSEKETMKKGVLTWFLYAPIIFIILSFTNNTNIITKEIMKILP